MINEYYFSFDFKKGKKKWPVESGNYQINQLWFTTSLFPFTRKRSSLLHLGPLGYLNSDRKIKLMGKKQDTWQGSVALKTWRCLLWIIFKNLPRSLDLLQVDDENLFVCKKLLTFLLCLVAAWVIVGIVDISQ